MNPLKSFPFNVRVYGIYIQNRHVLVSDERIFGQDITKFPGGGLHFGEGPADCILREMFEETGHRFEVLRHFYTTDFFQPSAFQEGHQVISIYYLLTTGEPLQFRISDKEFDYARKDGSQSFRWISENALDEEAFTLPIDRVVAGLLKSWFQQAVLKT